MHGNSIRIRFDLRSMYRECAAICRAAGLPMDDSAGGAIHQWVARNVRYRPGTEFFIVLGIVAEMSDLQAQTEGYKDQTDRALALAFGRSKTGVA